MTKFRLFPKGENLSSLIWMLFLLIPFLSRFPFDTFEKQFSTIVLLLFCWFYRNAMFQGKYFVYWLMGQYVVAAFYGLALGYVYLFMFPSWQMGFGFPKMKKSTFWLLFFGQMGIIVIGLIFGPIDNPAFGGNQMVMAIPFSLFTIIAPLPGREFQKTIEQRKQLYQANQRLEAVIKSEERNRIARELHDSLGQSLSVMTLKLDLAQKILAKNPQMVADELQEVEQLSRSTLKTVREIVSDMRKRSIREELIDMNQALTSAEIILTTENEELANNLSADQQNELSNVLREAVTNIIRHSKATFCTIDFAIEAGWLKLSIKDNGIGAKDLIAGNGLTGMKERVEKLCGTILIQDERGTRLSIAVPLEEALND
ncbi:sensor histidine kinase [Enterococcus sp. 669A]|uniref:histidine kinase n=1 Tax=Candidatus Enterococcus moelleringii TaxID=2815325 RepID=A0ABS3LAM1_9ENTE|nr:sensor histidine kinase [Enterococcus sp. 669A]MBO1306656.1 sensor histidine kinase [Enterococcus sp. 669A]